MRKELTPANKKLIKKYSSVITELRARPYTWLPELKNNKNNKELQRVSGHGSKTPQIKGSFLPIPTDPLSGKKPKVIFKNGKATIEYTNVNKTLLSFDMLALVDDPRKEVDRVIGDIDVDGKTIIKFAIQTGTHMGDIKFGIKNDVTDMILNWIGKYSAVNGVGPESTYDKWLTGVYVFEFTNQDIKSKKWFEAEIKSKRKIMSDKIKSTKRRKK